MRSLASPPSTSSAGRRGRHTLLRTGPGCRAWGGGAGGPGLAERWGDGEAEDGGWRCEHTDAFRNTERGGCRDPDPIKEVQTHREMGRKTAMEHLRCRERHRDLPRETETARENQWRGEVQEATQRQQERFGETLPPKRKRDRDRCVRERRGRAAANRDTGRVTEMQPPPGAEVPREASAGKRSAMGTDGEGGILPETCWNVEREDQRHRQGPGARDTQQVWDLGHVASPRCASVALSVKWGPPRHPPQTPAQGDSEFTPVKSQSTLSRCEPLPFSPLMFY